MIKLKKKFTDIELVSRSSMSGRFILEKLKVDSYGNPIESSRMLVAEFDNLILDQGLNRVGTATWMDACQVGTGSATPAFTDTGLQNRVAGTTSILSNNRSAQSTPPYYGQTTNTYRFAAGTATGNLSEVGVGWADIGAALFSRALILDGSGNPTTITVLSDEVLDVTYIFRVYPPTNDATYNVTISGVGTLSVLARASAVTSSGDWTVLQSGSIGGAEYAGQAYEGTLGPITGGPSGVSASGASIANAAYVNNSYQRSATLTADLTAWNLAGGIKSVMQNFGDLSAVWTTMQYEFSSVINKNSTNVLTLNFTHSWARRTI